MGCTPTQTRPKRSAMRVTNTLKIPNKNCQQKIVNILQNFGVCNLKLTWHVALIYKSLFEKLVECPDLLFDAVWVHGNVGVFPIGHHTPWHKFSLLSFDCLPCEGPGHTSDVQRVWGWLGVASLHSFQLYGEAVAIPPGSKVNPLAFNNLPPENSRQWIS